MGKVLVIRKTDKTIHQVPLANKPTLLAFNNRLPTGQKWTFEEMDEDKAAKLPFIDKEYVTAGEAVTKVKDLQATVDDKNAQIAALEARLKNLTKGEGSKEVAKVATKTKNDTSVDEGKTKTALEVIDEINEAHTAAQVKKILGDDDRKTVQDAAEKKIASFEK